MTHLLRKRADRFFETEMNNDVVLMNAQSGSFHALKGVGREIWDLIGDEADEEALLTELCRRFDVSRETCARDLQAFVARLEAAGFVERT